MSTCLTFEKRYVMQRHDEEKKKHEIHFAPATYYAWSYLFRLFKTYLTACKLVISARVNDSRWIRNSIYQRRMRCTSSATVAHWFVLIPRTTMETQRYKNCAKLTGQLAHCYSFCLLAFVKGKTWTTWTRKQFIGVLVLLTTVRSDLPHLYSLDDQCLGEKCWKMVGTEGPIWEWCGQKSCIATHKRA